MVMDIRQLFSHSCKMPVGLLNVHAMVKIVYITVKTFDAIRPDNILNIWGRSFV